MTNHRYVLEHMQAPSGQRRNNNVIMTSKRRRFDVIMTLLLRIVPVGQAQWRPSLGLVQVVNL